MITTYTKVHVNNSRKVQRGKMEISYYRHTTYEVISLEDCDKLEISSINPKDRINVTKQRTRGNKLTKE